MQFRRLAAAILATMLMSSIAAVAQYQYVYFSTRFAETPKSGRGGHITDVAAPTHPLVMGSGFVNEAAAMNSQGMAVVKPGFPNMFPITGFGCPTPPNCPPPPAMVVDFQEIANIPQFDLESGDTNGNGLYNDTSNGLDTGTSNNMSGIDAIWIPSAPAGRAANLHECFISVFGDHAGALGYRGTAITEADVFLLPAAPNAYPAASVPTPPVFFLRQSDLEIFFGMAVGSGNAMDTDAFAVDQSNGDIYISFDGASASNPNPFTGTFLSAPGVPMTAPIHAGDIFKIPGNAYTPAGPYGRVTAPLPGLVQRVYTPADVTTMVLAAGGCITGVSYTNTFSLDVDFTTPFLNVTPSGFTVKHLFFTIDSRGAPSATCPGAPPQNLTASAIYTTQLGGSFAVLNGTIMSSPSAVGMQDASFNAAFPAGPLDALDIVELPNAYDPVAGAPFHLDNFPNCYFHLNGPTPTPVITGYVAGAAPGATIAILMRVDFQVAGGFIDRYAAGGFGIAGYPDLFMDVYGLVNGSFAMGPAFIAPYGQNPLAQQLFNGGPGFANWNPIVTFSDPNTTPMANNGDSAFSMNLSPLVGGVPFPFVLTFQAVDLAQFKLSDAISFEFN